MGYKRGGGPGACWGFMIWGPFGSHLGPCYLGPIGAHLGPIFYLFGAHLGPFGAHFFICLGPIGAHLGPILFGAHLGPILALFWPSLLSPLGGLLVDLYLCSWGPKIKQLSYRMWKDPGMHPIWTSGPKKLGPILALAAIPFWGGYWYSSILSTTHQPV